MIPEELHLRNFLSHRLTDLDLRGVHLASLIGANGAGKSALLDAITWAVWGRSRAPYGHDDDLVYHGEEDLEVEYVFRMPFQGGDTRRCRILRRRERRGRRSVSSLLDFQIEGDDGWRILTSDSIRETQRRIIDYLGLDYDTFINSAYLRQGHADEFTVQSPTQRKRVLGAILGLERWATYRERAREHLAEVRGQMQEVERNLDEIRRELARRPEYEDALKTAEQRAEAAEARIAEIQYEVDALTRVQEQVKALHNQVTALEQRQTQDREHLAALEQEQEEHKGRQAYYQSLVEQAELIEANYQTYQEVVQEERAWGEKLSQAARLQEEKARQEREIGAARDALVQQLRAAEQLAAQHEREIANARAALESSLGQARAQIKMLQERLPTETMLADRETARQVLASLDQVAEEVVAARARLQDGEVELSRLQERNRHLREVMAEVKERLDRLAEVEADCPLCGQPLSEEHHARLLEEVAAQGTAMGNEYRANRQRHQELQEFQAELRAEIARLEGELRGRAAHEQNAARLDQQLEQGEEARRRVAELEREAAEIAQYIQTEEYAGEARAALAEAEEAQQGYQAQLDAQTFAPEARAALAEVLAQLSELGYDAEAHGQVKARLAELGSAESDYRELEKARIGVENESEILRRLEGEVAAQQARLAELAQELQQCGQELEQLEPQLARATAVAQQMNEARHEAAQARQQVGAARQYLVALETLEKRQEGLQEQHAQLAHRVALLDELRDAFGVNGIPAMIIEHTLPELEREANHILQQLTAGRMHVRFDTQRETKAGDLRETLDIIISDEKGTRPYENFSGGEQFRVNFAIRVALSRLLSQRSGVRLRSLFVDEGFGSLDADGRQRLVEAVKAVQEEFDLVLVITHIEELRESFPTQILVTKEDTGSQVMVL